MLAFIAAVLLTSPCPCTPPPPKPVCRMSRASCARLKELIEETEYLGEWDPYHIDGTGGSGATTYNNYYNTMGGS